MDLAFVSEGDGMGALGGPYSCMSLPSARTCALIQCNEIVDLWILVNNYPRRLSAH